MMDCIMMAYVVVHGRMRMSVVMFMVMITVVAMSDGVWWMVYGV